MFYDRYITMCQGKGVTPSRAAEEIGLNKATVTNWKKNGYTPRADVLLRIAEYFGVSMSFLVGDENIEKAPTQEGERVISDDDIKFALFGTREIDNDVLEQVKSFAKFARENRKDK